MKQCPMALSLQVCEKVVIEAETRNLTLVNCFTQRVVEANPPEPISFIVCSNLLGGRGRMPLHVRVESLEGFDIISERTGVISFRDPLHEIRLRIPMDEVAFPTKGRYQVVLLVDNQMVASRLIQITARA
jgi:hypothetical protein